MQQGHGDQGKHAGAGTRPTQGERTEGAGGDHQAAGTPGSANNYSPASNPNVITVSAIVDTDGKGGGLGETST